MPVRKPPVDWPTLEVVAVPIAELVPHAKNSRTHSAKQVRQIANSLLEFGWTQPVLRDEDSTILAGHGRVMGAALLVEEGHAHFGQVPVATARGWSDNHTRAYVIADNRIAASGGWDAGLLASELQSLSFAGFDMPVLGFGRAELARLIGDTGAGNGDPDAEVTLQTREISRPGDVWLLGAHRLMCGNSTDVVQVRTLLAGAKPHLMVTDPPYGVEYDPAWRNDRSRAGGQTVGARAVGKVLSDDRADWREAWALFPGDVAYVWHAGYFAGVVAESLQACGFELRAQIIWRKSNLAIGRGHYHWQHEPGWYAVRKGGTGHWQGDRKQSTVWDIAKPSKSETGHGTQKPVECMRRPILNSSEIGDQVYEPFSGSGTTLIAAQMTERTCFAMELSPAYVDVAVRRWQEFTQQEARHEASGETFAQRAAGDGEPDAAWA